MLSVTREVAMHYARIGVDSLRSVYLPDHPRIVAAVAAILGFLSGLFSDAQLHLLMVLGIAAVADLVAGSVAALRNRTWDFGRLYDGGLGKILKGHMVVVGLLVDRTILLAWPEGQSLRPAIEQSLPFATLSLVWLIAGELGSILSNIERGGQDVPSFLPRMIRYLRERVQGPDRRAGQPTEEAVAEQLLHDKGDDQ